MYSVFLRPSWCNFIRPSHCVLRQYVTKTFIQDPGGSTLKTDGSLQNSRLSTKSAAPSIILSIPESFKGTLVLDRVTPFAADVRIVDAQNTADNASTSNVGKRKKEEDPWRITPVSDASKLFNQYLMLSKFRLTSLVVLTSMAGYAMAPAPFELTTFLLCSVGTGLVSGAANSINQFSEVPFDAQMSRTKNRVLVRGILTPAHAVGFAIGASTIGLSMLYYGVNGLTATLGAINLILYTSIYTPMKRYSILNTWVGSIVGAIPPIMGWAACSGSIDTGAWILAGLLYAWQFPHFNALSWNLRPDYSRAGYRMMAVTNPALCRRVALRYTFVITGLSLLAPVLDVTNLWFALETLPLNAYFTYLAYNFYKKSDSGSSRKLFRFSLLHLPLLMALFLVNKKHWIFAEDKEKLEETAVTGAITNTSTSISKEESQLSNVTQLTNLIRQKL